MNEKESLEPVAPLTFRGLIPREQSQVGRYGRASGRGGGSDTREGEGLWVCYAALCWPCESLAGLILGLENLEEALAPQVVGAGRKWGNIASSDSYLQECCTELGPDPSQSNP